MFFIDCDLDHFLIYLNSDVISRNDRVGDATYQIQNRSMLGYVYTVPDRFGSGTVSYRYASVYT